MRATTALNSYLSTMGHDHESSRNLRLAFFLNAGFAALEFVGGVWTGSLAVISDAVHDLGDTLSLGLSWYLQRKSQKGRTREYTYGMRRFSLLGALITSSVLIVGAIWMITEALPKLWEPGNADAKGMMWMAFLGIAVNGFAAWRVGRGSSLNEKAISLHLVEDLLGWVAVLIGSVVMMYTDWRIIDPILSLAISGFILWNAIKTLRKSLRIFLMAVPENVNPEAIQSRLLEIAPVRHVHDLHVWSLDGEYNILTVNLELDLDLPLSEQPALREKVQQALVDFEIHHVTVEFSGPGIQAKAHVSGSVE